MSVKSSDGERLEEIAREIEDDEPVIGRASYLRNLAKDPRLSPERGEEGREKVVFPVHRIAALFGRDDRQETRTNLIGRLERDVEDMADKGEHLADATNRMGLELVLRATASIQPVSPQPDPTTRLSEGTGDDLRHWFEVGEKVRLTEAYDRLPDFGRTGRVLDSDIIENKRWYEIQWLENGRPLKPTRHYTGSQLQPATTQKPQDEEER